MLCIRRETLIGEAFDSGLRSGPVGCNDAGAGDKAFCAEMI